MLATPVKLHSQESDIETLRDFFREQNDRILAEKKKQETMDLEVVIGEGSRHFKVQSMPITWEDNPSSFLHVFNDITDTQQLEQQKTSIKFQRLMLATISHEFKTPINSILG